MPRPKQHLPNDAQIRGKLGPGIVLCGAIGVLALAAAIIIFAAENDKPEMSRLAFSSVVPLFATWVGAVIAFYFSNENLQAATDSVVRLTPRISSSTVVSEVMIRRNLIDSKSLANGEEAGKLLLVDLNTIMQTAGRRRLPILLDNGAAKYVLHDSLISGYAADLPFSLSDPRFETTTLQKLLDSGNNPKRDVLASAIVFVAVTADLGTARNRMEEKPYCADVFVTATGSATEPIQGWLTSTLLATVT